MSCKEDSGLILVFIVFPSLPLLLLERKILQFKQANINGKSIYSPSIIKDSYFIRKWYLDDGTSLICPNCGKVIGLLSDEWEIMLKK